MKNVTALQQVIAEQSLAVEFEYHGALQLVTFTPTANPPPTCVAPLRFHCDVPTIVLSEGKSIFPVDIHVPFRPEGPAEMHVVGGTQGLLNSSAYPTLPSPAVRRRGERAAHLLHLRALCPPHHAAGGA